MLKNLKNFPIFCILLSLFCLYYFNVFKFFIGGDDWFLMIDSPNKFKDFLNLFTQIQQYRPIPKAFFAIYKILPFNLTLFHLISIILHSLNSFLFYFFLNKFLKIKKAIGLAFSFLWGISHISFYLVYALAGMVDQIFILFFWLCILNFLYYRKTQSMKFFCFSWFSFLLALFSKEIFISIPIILTSYTILNRDKNIIKQLSLFWIPTIIFFILKFALYIPALTEYSYSLNIKLLFVNLKQIFLWLINYRHGWQMGMPLPESFLYQVLTVISLVFYIGIFFYNFKKDKINTIFLSAWFIASLVPFYFLNRILVFYLDIALFSVLALSALFFNQIRSNKFKILGLIIFTAIQIFFSLNIKKQWLVYSFVANASLTSQGFYNQVIKKYDWSNNNKLCISEINSDALWAIKNGEVINYFSNKKINILINPKDICSNNSLKLKQIGHEFINID